MNTIDERVKKCEEEVKAVQARNARVEAEKAWETSGTRIVLLCLMTYAIAVLVMRLMAIPYPLRNALVPTVGLLLSVQSLPWIKKKWVQNKLLHDNK